jgi:undecaprenyl-diphosphatase
MLGSELVVLWALFIGGIVIILVETFKKEGKDASEDLATLSYKTVFLIGLSQALAVIPGVSRAGATIMGGLFLGMKRASIVEFSFLLAVPTMIAATALDLLKNAHSFSSGDAGTILVGFVVSFIVAIGAIKFFLRFIGTHTFVPFGIYRIVVALLFFFFII